MQHNETRITMPMPSSSIRNVVQVPGKIMYFTSSLQILCAIITAITKIWISIEIDTCSDIFHGAFTYYIATFFAIPGVLGIIQSISPRKIIILCMIGSQVISSLLSLALMFMGFLGISDLRNPNQWYCSDGDKNRNHAVSYALFALLVIVGFVQICVTVISILLSCYTAFCATKSYPGIVCNCNNPSLNDQPNIWRSEATEVTDPIRPPDYPPSYSESEQPRRDQTEKY